MRVGSVRFYRLAKEMVTSLTCKDAGAREAADWAIARSLSALVRATEEGNLQDPTARLETQVEQDEGEEDDDDDDKEV